ncbi:MAG: hypothetical protein RL698_665, partial [Pseudomonadota bacterium]
MGFFPPKLADFCHPTVAHRDPRDEHP